MKKFLTIIPIMFVLISIDSSNTHGAVTLSLPNDPYFYQQGALTGISRISEYQALEVPSVNAFLAWQVHTACQRAPIAILSTGIDYNNTDISAALTADRARNKNFVVPASGTNATDDRGEGSGLAGIIGATSNNASKIAGICKTSRLIPIKVLDLNGVGTWANLAAGIRHAIASSAKVILISSGENLSATTPSELTTVTAALNEAQAAGALVVVPSSVENDSQDTDAVPFYPASLKLANIISVSPVDISYQIVGGASKTAVTIAAPGVGVISHFLTSQGGLATFYGPAIAAAHVAAAAALYWDKNPTATACAVKKAIVQTATVDSSQSLKNQAGGWLNIDRLIRLAVPSCAN